MRPRDHVLMAIQSNRPDIVAHFIHQIDLTEKNKDKKTLVEIASELKSWDCVRVIVENITPDSHDSAGCGYALVDALTANNIQIAFLLLKAGAEKDTVYNGNCLHLAVTDNNANMVALLF